MIDPHREALLNHAFHRLMVKHVVRETADTKTFALDVPAEIRPLFTYRPGQFCTFRVGIEGAQHLRSYSMSTAPDLDPDPAVTVKRVGGGLVSNWFNDSVSEGDLLEVTRPAGVFCPTESGSEIVAFCAGSGITPVMSIVKSVLAAPGRAVRLLYANRDPESVIFADQLKAMCSDQPDRLEVVHHFDTHSGFVGPDDISSFVGCTTDADFYICGPSPFMDLVEASLVDAGVEAGRIMIERFNVEAPVPSASPAGEADVLAPASTKTVTIVLEGKPKEIPYRAGDTILDTARRAALPAPFSCEAGNCATCMAFLREGAVRMRTNNALSKEEVEEGWVLTCQSLPTSPTVTVEYEAI